MGRGYVCEEAEGETGCADGDAEDGEVLEVPAEGVVLGGVISFGVEAEVDRGGM